MVLALNPSCKQHPPLSIHLKAPALALWSPSTTRRACGSVPPRASPTALNGAPYAPGPTATSVQHSASPTAQQGIFVVWRHLVIPLLAGDWRHATGHSPGIVGQLSDGAGGGPGREAPAARAIEVEWVPCRQPPGGASAACAVTAHSLCSASAAPPGLPRGSSFC